ncbi:cutinase [Choiromyces venosus 120613-1]|uniref:Cutinase n=1 Tax=Choiromyces venosus 120613-1 TaxID=1336337 RepID=A0A3N4J284_9PEZI|nr:cutinase [Choiromyces venosus 120613-1]
MKFTLLSLLFTTALASPVVDLEKRHLSSTRNDLNDGKCGSVLVIYARGTTEAGNVGLIAGPPFFRTLDDLVDDLAVQGVDYPADVAGYLAGGSTAGATTMANLVAKAVSSCPNTKIVLSGYSQGAQVTHLAAAKIPASSYPRIAAIVVFGDPYEGYAFPGTLNNNVKTFCNVGDKICLGLPIVLAPHLTYGLDADEAAEYVAARV